VIENEWGKKYKKLIWLNKRGKVINFFCQNNIFGNFLFLFLEETSLFCKPYSYRLWWRFKV